MRITAIKPNGSSGFSIAPSDRSGQRRALVAADSATCQDCLRELADPADRRFGYPFVNCTNCGPRFTIVRDVPYDRPLTTMAGFPMCAECASGVPRSRGSQVSCAAGVLSRPAARGCACLTRRAATSPGEPLEQCARLLAEGHVLAVKGLGGYHLAVDAGSESAAAALRARKHREDKPFAIMVPDAASARGLCVVDAAAESLLTSARRPIVLLPRRPGAPVARAVAPGSHHLGLMLPYTPLHHLLLRRLGRPIVLTSGNSSDEPIAYRDDDAARQAGRDRRRVSRA